MSELAPIVGHWMKGYARWIMLAVVLVVVSASAQIKLEPEQQKWLQEAAKFPKNGWIYLSIKGKAYERGFQHGYLMAREIDDALSTGRMTVTMLLGVTWQSLTERAQRLFWEKTPVEYQEEMQGISDGARAAGVEVSLADILTLNGMMDLIYLLEKCEEQSQAKFHKPLIGCSAFIATGNATFDGRIVMAHNTWAPYFLTKHMNVILYLAPEKGNEIAMQSIAGLIHSSTDYYITSGGLMVTETTISDFVGSDPEGIPEFVRIRKAVQYASSIAEFAAIMREGNNGAYPNDWLIGDIKTGEIACLEMGLKYTPLLRTYNGYFVGSNMAVDEDVRREEARADYTDMRRSNTARWARFQHLMHQYYGELNIALARQFLADHYDSYLEKYNPCERTICGHGDLTSDEPTGASDGKVSDSELAARMMFWAKFGCPCHTPFIASDFLKRNPHLMFLMPYLKDMPDLPWTLFKKRDNME